MTAHARSQTAPTAGKKFKAVWNTEGRPGQVIIIWLYGGRYNSCLNCTDNYVECSEPPFQGRTLMLSHASRRVLLSVLVLTGGLAVSIMTIAQTSNKGPIVRYTATTDNVASPGQAVRIELFAWSNDTDRDQLAK